MRQVLESISAEALGPRMPAERGWSRRALPQVEPARTRVHRLPFVAGAAILIASVWAAIGVQGMNERHEVLAAAVERNENLAFAFEQYSIRTIQAADAATRHLKAAVERRDPVAAIGETVASGLVDKTLFQAVGVIDDVGQLVATTLPGGPSVENYADRQHFAAHLRRDDGTLHVGSLVVSKRLGVASIPVTRRINKPDGAFGGVVIVQISPDRFTDFYNSADLGRGDFISLSSVEGGAGLRRTGDADGPAAVGSGEPLFREVARSPPAGTGSSAQGGAPDLILSHRTLDHYPLAVTVGTVKAEVLTEFSGRQRVYYWAGTLISGLVVCFVFLLSAAEGRRQRSANTAIASEERLQFALRVGRMLAWERDIGTGHVTRSGDVLNELRLESGHYTAFMEKIHPDDHARVEAFFADGKYESGTIEFRFPAPLGGYRWFGLRAQLKNENTLVGVTFDITDRKTAEAEVWRVANLDHLTGLPNRVLFQVRFVEALERARANGTSVSLLLLDLDDFKDVNDTLGHDAGDALLKRVSARLQAMVRDIDTVARIGGDEFGILVVEPLSFENASRLADHVVETIREPFTYESRTLSTKVSIGVSAFPDHDVGIPDLMKDADIALYRAKAEGRNRAVAFSPDMRVRTERRVQILDDVRQALRDEQFVPFYQPKICFRTGEVVGFEALARWLHPQQGVLTPGVFGEAFDDPELAERIGEQMFGRVASDVAGWLSAGVQCGRIAVNLSSAEFRHPGLADLILSEWTAKGAPVDHLEIEVTESVFLGAAANKVAGTLKRFREKGVKVALDDFGTGFASLSHLKQFEVDHIKIDQSFVRGLLASPHDQAIVSAIIGLGRSFRMDVTAEGVETEAQAAHLRALGCHFAQGYLYAKPMAASRVAFFLKGRADAAAAVPARMSA